MLATIQFTGSKLAKNLVAAGILFAEMELEPEESFQVTSTDGIASISELVATAHDAGIRCQLVEGLDTLIGSFRLSPTTIEIQGNDGSSAFIALSVELATQLVTLPSLAGVGVRNVVVDANGKLSAP